MKEDTVVYNSATQHNDNHNLESIVGNETLQFNNLRLQQTQELYPSLQNSGLPTAPPMIETPDKQPSYVQHLPTEPIERQLNRERKPVLKTLMLQYGGNLFRTHLELLHFLYAEWSRLKEYNRDALDSEFGLKDLIKEGLTVQYISQSGMRFSFFRSLIWRYVSVAWRTKNKTKKIGSRMIRDVMKRLEFTFDDANPVLFSRAEMEEAFADFGTTYETILKELSAASREVKSERNAKQRELISQTEDGEQKETDELIECDMKNSYESEDEGDNSRSLGWKMVKSVQTKARGLIKIVMDHTVNGVRAEEYKISAKEYYQRQKSNLKRVLREKCCIYHLLFRDERYTEGMEKLEESDDEK